MLKDFKITHGASRITDKGIYCPQAGVYLDPWKPVAKALITHGHADHARWGHESYLRTEEAVPVIRYRLNTSSPIQIYKVRRDNGH